MIKWNDEAGIKLNISVRTFFLSTQRHKLITNLEIQQQIAYRIIVPFYYNLLRNVFEAHALANKLTGYSYNMVYNSND